MLRIPGKIPVVIHPVFWLLAGLIGYLNSGNVAGTAVWALVIFISLLVHEFGHAIMAYIFKKKPVIQLLAFGGATIYSNKGLSKPKEFLIVLCGPLFGFLLFVVTYLMLQADLFSDPLVISILQIFSWVNLFWTILNLVPVLPLDGGQLLRIALEGFFGLGGYKAALLIGTGISLLICFFFFISQNFLIGALFFLFAFQSFDLWRRSRGLSASDREGDNADEIKKGEKALALGQIEEAIKIFDSVRSRVKSGAIYTAATFYLAMIAYERGDTKSAYELLLPVETYLEAKALCLLQELSFEMKNYDLVVKLSSDCYKTMPTEDVALRNARAFGLLGQAEPAGGWLKRAVQFGVLDEKKIMAEQVFEGVREDPRFLQFFS